MSSTFDTMQHALEWLSKDDRKDSERTRQVVYYFRMVIDKFHDLHHDGFEELNRTAGTQVALLNIVLRHNDPETRQLYLDARMGKRIKRVDD